MKKILVSKKRFVLPVLCLLMVQVAMASYTATISPLSVPLNTPTAFTMSVTSNVQQLGAITITFPAGMTAPTNVSTTPPGGKAWTVTAVTATSISLAANGTGQANRLDNGQTILIQFTSSVTSAGGMPFTVAAYTNQNFSGGGVGDIAGGQPVVNDPNNCPAVSDRLYVNGAIATAGSGASWACAIKELRDAVMIANSNNAIKSIWVAKGTYKATAGADRTATLLITRGDLKIMGGFNSGDVSEAAANPVLNTTTISGDINVGGDATDNSYHLFTIRNVPAASPIMIDGFVLTAGNANTAGTLGGSGAAILAYDDNVATTISISRCRLMANSSTLYGGAIFAYRTNLTITGCHLSGNSSASGGAMYGYFSNSVISKSVFAGNSATSGGAYYGNFGTPGFDGCVFAGNTATSEGGATYQNQSNMGYANCVFSNNSSNWSGAIHLLAGSTAGVTNCTFFQNAATNTQGAGAILLGYNNCTVAIANSIFWKNTVAGMDNVVNADIKNVYGSTNTVLNTMLQANTSMNVGANNTVGVDPLFTNEASPIGADAAWMTNDDGLQLTSGSPAYNSGDNTYTISTDILGNTRINCGTVDRGAYERACASAPAREQYSKKEIEPATIAGLVANPFSNDLQVRYNGTEKASLKVYDVSGKPRYNNNSISQGVTHIDAGSWGKGMYQVVITGASGKQMIIKAMKF